MVEDRRHDRLWRLVLDRAAHRSFSGWAGLVCEVAAAQVHVDGAAIALRLNGRAEDLIAVTGEWAGGLEEIQYTVGDGPGVDAYLSGGPVLMSDLRSAEARWPGFIDAAADVGMRAVFAFPLQAGAIRLGTLDLYRRKPDPLERDELADAAALADLATTALLTDTRGRASELAPWAREDAPGHYDDVNVATGMLAAALRISVEDAFVRLRAHAFGHHQPLLDVARAVLARQLRAEAFLD